MPKINFGSEEFPFPVLGERIREEARQWLDDPGQIRLANVSWGKWNYGLNFGSGTHILASHSIQKALLMESEGKDARDEWYYAAAMEEDSYADCGDFNTQVITLMSAMTCWLKAEKPEAVIRIADKIRRMGEKPPEKIREEIKMLEADAETMLKKQKNEW